MINGMSLFKF